MKMHFSFIPMLLVDLLYLLFTLIIACIMDIIMTLCILLFFLSAFTLTSTLYFECS